MARNRADHFAATDLSALIDETLFLLERELSKYRIRVERDLPAVPPVLAIGNQIQQVLLNLLINARQAMSNGGLLVVRLVHDPQAATVDLVVRDTGPGIPAEHLPRIFEPFFSTKQGEKGVGLGLSVVYGIIKEHRGTIYIKSEVDKGSRFTLRFARAESGEGLPLLRADNATDRRIEAPGLPMEQEASR
jgi:signal transduction histidine kinase